MRRVLLLATVLNVLIGVNGCDGFFISTRSSIVLTSSATNASTGTAITLTGTVAPTNATGTVTFYDGTTSLGTGTLSSGVATFSANSLAAGSHSLTAVYGGDSRHDESSSIAVAVTITGAASWSSTSLAVSSTDSGETTMIAIVSPMDSSGEVQFYDGNLLVGSAKVVMGKATLKTVSTAGKSASISASYVGDETRSASWSDAVSVAEAQ